VVRVALQDAPSVAGLLITRETVAAGAPKLEWTPAALDGGMDL
jgi:hypothetical protein